MQPSMMKKLLAFDKIRFAQRTNIEMTDIKQNGVAERRWQIVGNMARCLLKRAKITYIVWGKSR